MEITSYALNNFAPCKIFGGGQICNDEYPSKIPRMSISTALWKRSLTNAIISECCLKNVSQKALHDSNLLRFLHISLRACCFCLCIMLINATVKTGLECQFIASFTSQLLFKFQPIHDLSANCARQFSLRHFSAVSKNVTKLSPHSLSYILLFPELSK